MQRKAGFSIVAVLLFIVALIASPSAAAEPAPSIKLHFPPKGGIVYGRPHVLIIFDIDGVFQTLVMKLDGREIPQSVFTFCPICAGNHTAILTSDVPWGAVEGHHVLTIDAQESNGRKTSILWPYSVDVSRPSLSGLSGHILLPDAFVAEQTLVAGGSWLSGRPGGAGFAAAAVGGPIPTEVSEATGPGGGFSWKTQISEHPTAWNVAAGQLQGHSFGVVSFRTVPPQFELSLGFGSGYLSHGWLGASYVLTHLTKRKPAKGILGDLLAVSELVTLEGEVDDRGRVNFGATLLHPYGWSLGLYRVNMVANNAWRLAATYRFAVK